MERILVPTAIFAGGFIVGKNWNKIVKVSKPYVRKGLKNAQKFTSESLEAIQRAASEGMEGAVSMIKKHSKPIAAKAATKRKKAKLATA